MSFSNLKKSRKDAMAALVAEAEKLGSTKKFDDSKEKEEVWKPTVDKAGNGFAIIRFLPAPANEDLPWVRFWDHGFKGPTGKWYIEKSLTTLGQNDPVSEANTVLWESGIESNKQIARDRKRKLHYVSNILVISDTSAPENEGKVFKFVYGKKIFDKLMDVMQPEFEDEKAFSPFDFWEGANFKLKIRNEDDFRNYDKSSFEEPSPLFGGDDAKLEAIYNMLYPLKVYTDPASFKSYDELKVKLLRVLGESAAAPSSIKTERKSEEAPEIKSAQPREVSTADESSNSSIPSAKSSDTLGYFSQLAQKQ